MFSIANCCFQITSSCDTLVVLYHWLGSNNKIALLKSFMNKTAISILNKHKNHRAIGQKHFA